MSAAGGGPELLEAGPPPRSPEARRRRRLLLAAAVVLLVALGLTTLLQRQQEAVEEPVPTPGAASTTRSPTPLPVSSTRRPQSDAPSVLRRSGAPVDGLGSGELFVRSLDTVYRVGLASGRVTATPAAVGMSAPVAFLAGPSQVVLRPLDRVPGLLVPDDRPAVPLRGTLRRAARVLPATSGRLWVGGPFDGRRSSLELLDFDGRSVGRRMAGAGTLVPDGSGGLLLVDASGVQEQRDGRWHRITTGTVLATGPRHYLFADCRGGHAACTTSRYDRRSRASTRVPAEQSQLFGGGGLISADGRYVASMTYGPDGGGVADVVDLASGRLVIRLAEPSASADITSVATWSPDGRHLAALEDGRLIVLDPATGRTREPDLSLPPLVGLTLRTP